LHDKNSIVQKNTIHKIYPVTGMSCASCTMSVETIAASVPSVQQASVNFATQALDVYFNPQQTDQQQIQKAVQNVGYDLILDEDNAFGQQEEQQEKALTQLKKQTLGAVLLTVPVVLLDMVLMDWKPANWIMLILTSVVLFVFGKRFFVNAWKQAQHGHANMDSLVAISTGVAYLFSLFNTIDLLRERLNWLKNCSRKGKLWRWPTMASTMRKLWQRQTDRWRWV